MLLSFFLKSLFICTLMNCLSVHSGPAEAENHLKGLFHELSEAREAVEREIISQNIKDVLETVLKREDSYEYPFDSLDALGRIASADNRLRVFTWNYSDSPVDHSYFGFLQYRPAEDDTISLFFLDHNKTFDKKEFDNLTFSPENWYGALYYQIHEVTHEGNTMYTLIGFDFNDVFTNIKLIDALSFTNDSPVFGTPVFQFKDGIRNRVIFEYSSKVVMMVRYVPAMDMIIYDHLSPGSPRLKGLYRYYGPDFSYDGLRFVNGRWIHQQDVEWSP